MCVLWEDHIPPRHSEEIQSSKLCGSSVLSDDSMSEDRKVHCSGPKSEARTFYCSGPKSEARTFYCYGPKSETPCNSTILDRSQKLYHCSIVLDPGRKTEHSSVLDENQKLFHGFHSSGPKSEARTFHCSRPKSETVPLFHGFHSSVPKSETVPRVPQFWTQVGNCFTGSTVLYPNQKLFHGFHSSGPKSEDRTFLFSGPKSETVPRVPQFCTQVGRQNIPLFWTQVRSLPIPPFEIQP